SSWCSDLLIPAHYSTSHLSAFRSLITRPPPTSTLFPYTTLFRSRVDARQVNAPARFHSGKHGFLFVLGHTLAGEQLAQHRKQNRSEEHTSELQSRENLVCRLLLEKKK